MAHSKHSSIKTNLVLKLLCIKTRSRAPAIQSISQGKMVESKSAYLRDGERGGYDKLEKSSMLMTVSFNQKLYALL